MKTSEILNLDYREVSNKVIIQKALRKIKGFTGYPMQYDINIAELERYIYVCEIQYEMMINYICPTFLDCSDSRYCATIRSKSSDKITDYVYATCIYELYAKICILYYSKIKNSKCKRIDWKEVNEKRKERLGK